MRPILSASAGVLAPRPLILVVMVLSLAAGQAAGAAPTPVSVAISKVGSTSPASAPYATDADGQNEIDLALNGDADGTGGTGGFTGTNRTVLGASQGNGRPVKAAARAKSNPVLGVHFDGLNFHDQRFANGGNQFSVEPPDQGMCAGNGYVVEAVNDVLQVYDSSGNALLNSAHAVDLNSFLGYAPAIVRSGPNVGQRGPSVTDPSCLYDAAIGRFVLVALTLDHIGFTAALSGTDHLDIAVSDTGNPTGTWTIYRLPVQNDGTQGTPDHGCIDDRSGSFLHGPCLGDYPHIGADANGIYLTTNEFDFFGPFFEGAQVYGIGNNLLTGQPGSAVLFSTVGLGPDGAGFTVWPAQGNQFDGAHGGTEYFLSSDAVFFGASTNILLWSFTGTASLNSSAAGVGLNVQAITVDQYAPPPRAKQPAGSRPLSQCIADLGFPCNLLVAGINTHDNSTFGPPNGKLNSNDSRMGQVFYANGKLWGALGTAVTVGGNTRAGIAYYVVNPHSGKLDLQGQAGFADTDMTYPEVGVLPNGRGVLAFTLTGDNDYPSAGFASLDAKIGMGPVAVAAAGAGPWDGFTSYVQFGAGRPRWGDYGATAVDGNSIWIASEYIAQTCSYSDYLVVPRGQCGGTRGALGNWATHISKLTP
jgi:hypothetical protein